MKILLGALGGAASEVGGDALVVGSPKLGRGPAASSRIATSLFRSKACSKAGNKDKGTSLRRVMGPALIGDEVAAASEVELQFGDLLPTCLELSDIRPDPSLG